MDRLQINIDALIKASQIALVDSSPCVVEYVDSLAPDNNRLPPSLGQTPVNVYALWKREVGRHWELMYIGQRSSKSGWSRIRQHLFSTPKGTQSKLKEVQAVIKSGSEIGVTAVLVEPDSMRLAIEEELIKLNSVTDERLLWNRKARAKPASKKTI